MTYNVDTITPITGSLSLTKKAKQSLVKQLECLPEVCFLEEHKGGVIQLLEWCGEFSGSAWDLLLEEVLPETTGEASYLVVWEGGDQVEVLTVRDGVVQVKDAIPLLRKQLATRGEHG